MKPSASSMAPPTSIETPTTAAVAGDMKLTGYSLAAKSSAVFQLDSLMTPDAKKISASASRINTSTLGHTKP